MLARYEDLEAPGVLLYHRPGIKEEKDWEVLLVADPRCILEIETALHEFVYRFSLYNNRVESPERGWENLLADIKAYRQEMAQRRRRASSGRDSRYVDGRRGLRRRLSWN